MRPNPSILVLLDEHDPYPEGQRDFLWSIAEVWRTWGIEIRVARGTRAPAAQIPADLVFNHVNLTVTPAEYRRLLDGAARTVNGRVFDISKRAISSNLVDPDDGYDGPVVVKTDRNYGGHPEMRHRRRARNFAGLLDRARRRLSGPPPLSRATTLSVGDYRVFERAAEVPAGVWSNPALVVERFLPERRGNLYYCRMYTFLGDHEVHEELSSPSPIVKGGNVVSKDIIPPNADIVALRHELGFDYGKFDYVVRDGETILLDANRTPGHPGDPKIAAAKAARLAGGIRSLLPEARQARRIG